MFHLISFSLISLFKFHFYFLQSTVHLIHFTYHSPSRSCLPYLVVFILHGHSTSLSVSLFSQSRLWKLTNPQGSLDTFLILDRYSLLEADRWCFYYSLSLYIKQEIQHSVRSAIQTHAHIRGPGMNLEMK